MKDGDVFRWYFKNDAEYRKKHAASGTAYWTMDNQCVYREGKGLIDTYWSGIDGKYSSDCSKYVTEDEADLEFVCNLNEVEFIWEQSKDEYDKVYNLSHQKNSYKVYAVDRGVGKSKADILAKKERELVDVKSELEYLQRKVVRLAEEVEQLSSEISLRA